MFSQTQQKNTMWIIFVISVSYACGDQVRISPAPLVDVDENSNVTLTCDYNGALAPLEIWWFLYPFDYSEATRLNMSCIRTSGTLRQNEIFTCDVSIGKFQMTIRNVSRERDGQIWRCAITAFNNTHTIYEYSNRTVLNVRDETPQNATNPVSTTIFPSSSSTAPTSMVSTSQLPPSYVTDLAQTATNPVSTTFPSSSSTASASMVSTSQLPPSYVPDPGEYELHLEFDLKVEMAYNHTYADKTSPHFQSLAKTFSISLTEVFKDIKGFKSIDILGFSQGSVHVNYSVNAFGTADVATVTKEIRTNIVSSLTSIAGVPVNTEYTHDSMKRRLDNMETRDKCSLASKYLCPFGYYCKPAIASTSIILCIDRCNSSVCQNNGECYIGHHSDDVQCRCGFSENVVYSGQRCEIKTGVVTVQERNLYLIIACAIVGGILVVFISTVCVINRKRNRLKKRLTISHVLQLDEMHKRSNNGVPAMDERYVISLNPALRRYPEGYCGGRVNVSYQDQRLDGGYLQARDCRRRNSDEDYDYIGPEFEVGSRSQHN